MKRKKKIIILFALIFGILFFNTIVYWPIISFLDSRLAKKAELIKEGMSEQQVIEIMGKPKRKEIISLDLAIERGLPRELAEKVDIKGSILWYYYYVPSISPIPFLLRPWPYKTAVAVFFDGNKRVCYKLKAEGAKDFEPLILREEIIDKIKK